MRSLSDIPIPSGSEYRRDSLVLALQAALRWWSARDTSYDELIALTAIGSMLPFTDRDPCPGRWCDFGRDAFLVDAAEHLGLSLRDLHPPDAVPLPATPPEFELHWRDSYVPLVATALAHHQPVLAWMGWPAPHQTQWGIITTLDARTRRCAGIIAGVPQLIALDRAAVQAYVAQEFTPTETNISDRVRSAAARAGAMLRNEGPARFSVQTGSAALGRLQARLSEREFCPVHRADSWRCLGRLADECAARRRAAAGWFAAARQPALAEALQSSAESIAALSPTHKQRETWVSPSSRHEPIGAIEHIRAADIRLADAFSSVT